MVIAGGVLLATATGMALGLAGVRGRRAQAAADLAALRADVEAAGGKTHEQDAQADALRAVNTWTRVATIALSVSAGVLAALGLGLVAAGTSPRRTERTRLAPYGGPQGAGIAVFGHF